MENTIINRDGSQTAFHDSGSDLIIEHKQDIKKEIALAEIQANKDIEISKTRP